MIGADDPFPMNEFPETNKHVKVSNFYSRFTYFYRPMKKLISI